MNTNFRIAVLVALVLLGACSDSSSPPRSNDAIRGLVLDAEGLPVAGASIMLQHESAPLPDKPQLAIRFTHQESGPVSVWIASYCDSDTVRWLANEALPAGEFMFVWNGRDDLGRVVPDGVYQTHVVSSAGHAQATAVVSWLGYADLAPGTPVAAQATTDSFGRFRLAQDCLPFGHTYEGFPGVEAVTRRVRVWALHPDFITGGGDWVTVDAEGGAEATVTLAR
jgi:hypothetical protein